MAFSDLKNPYNFEYNKNLNKDEENNAQKKIYFVKFNTIFTLKAT